MAEVARFCSTVMALLKQPDEPPRLEPLPDLHWLLVQVRYQQAKFKELGDAIERTIEAEATETRQ